MYTKRKIIHIDMDAFFASVEQKDNPHLKGRPLIVGGNPKSRGVVAACSYEARRFGVHSAMPCAKAAKLCPNGIFVRPRMQRYKEISLLIMSIFHQYTHLVEPLSLDEAFLDVTENTQNNPSATILATSICRQIYRELGLTASAGASFNKFLAKVASDLNKPNGVSTITPDQAIEFLSALPIGKFFGVGQRRERPMLDARRQCESPQEVSQVVRQHVQLQSHLIGGEVAAAQSSPAHRVLAFLDPLLGGAAAVVEVHHALGAAAEVGHDEPDARE